jgi:hypothetical protein
MQEKPLYVRIRGKVLGPFGFTQLKTLRDRGQFRRFHEVSEDRKNWVPASTLSDLFPGEEAMVETDGHLREEPSAQADVSLEPVIPSQKESAPQQSPAEWYYIDSDEKRHGPVSRETLISLHFNGAINGSTPVWKAGLSEWLEFSSPAAGMTVPLSAHDSAPAQAVGVGGRARQQSATGQTLEDWQAAVGWRRLRVGITLVLLSVFLWLGTITLVLFSIWVSTIGKEKPAVLAFVLAILALLLGFTSQVTEAVGYGFCAAASVRGNSKGLAITAFILAIATSVLATCILILFLTTGLASPLKANGPSLEVAAGVVLVFYILALLLGIVKPVFFQFHLRATAISLCAREFAKGILYMTILYGAAAFLLFFVLFIPMFYPPLSPFSEASRLGTAALTMVVFEVITAILFLIWVIWFILVLFKSRHLIAERLPV